MKDSAKNAALNAASVLAISSGVVLMGVTGEPWWVPVAQGAALVVAGALLTLLKYHLRGKCKPKR